VVESANFTFLMGQFGLTWGNLSAHITKLEKGGYVAVEKGFETPADDVEPDGARQAGTSAPLVGCWMVRGTGLALRSATRSKDCCSKRWLVSPG